ncbi:autotransporter outer membrane beta-barrel domain-containing protein [Selenomonas montiformis]|uniref:autotransporter outer membrane beta-barrel domain-containing protein n=1 Tax=Selenomonas montiformis TaxID=2652285 RepID=UPI0039F54430
MVQNGQVNKKSSKWLRLAVGTALLAGVSGAVIPDMADAAEVTVSDDGTYYSGLWKKDAQGVEGKDWKFAADNLNNTVAFDGFQMSYDHYCAAGSNMSDGEGTPGDEAVTGNTLTITNSKMWGKVAGGYSTGNQEVSGNVVTIGAGTTVADGGSLQIFGGISKSDSQNIKDNTVNILTAIKLNALKGGENSNYSAGNNGNTLNVAAKGVETEWFGGFETINFFLPSDIQVNETMLKVTNDYGTDLSGVKVGVAAQSGVSLKQGDTVNLLESQKLSNAPAETTKIADKDVKMIAAGNVLSDKEYTFTLGATDTALTATVKSITDTAGGAGNTGDSEVKNVIGDDNAEASAIKTSQRVKSLVETQAAAATVLNMSSDMLTGAGFTQAKTAAAAAQAGEFAPFAAMGGSNLRVKSGSHVDTKGYNLNVGFAREVKKGNKTYLLAPVVEYGRGNYDSYQNNGIKADGKSRLWGVGVMGRQTNSRGLYYEGSLRVGRVSSDYNGWLSSVTHASYDSDSNYWAGHIGVGTVAKINGKDTLDTYAKYFYSQQDGDKVRVKIDGAADDQIEFDNVESQRLRLGARLTHQVNENSSLYGGVAYQAETKGEDRATYHGNETAAPSVKGSSVMMELGWQVKPGNGPVSVDLGVTGWAGKQRGVIGNLGLKWNF